MEKIYVVTIVSNSVQIVEFASEDGERYQAPTKDWAKVFEPRRLVRGGEVRSLGGAFHGTLDSWSYNNGVHEFWTRDADKSSAVAQTVLLARSLDRSSRTLDWNPPM